MANEGVVRRITSILHYVADNIGEYLPNEWLLEGSSLVVRIGDLSELPTVELNAVMPAKDENWHRVKNGTTSEQS